MLHHPFLITTVLEVWNWRGYTQCSGEKMQNLLSDNFLESIWLSCYCYLEPQRQKSQQESCLSSDVHVHWLRNAKDADESHNLKHAWLSFRLSCALWSGQAFGLSHTSCLFSMSFNFQPSPRSWIINNLPRSWMPHNRWPSYTKWIPTGL